MARFRPICSNACATLRSPAVRLPALPPPPGLNGPRRGLRLRRLAVPVGQAKPPGDPAHPRSVPMSAPSTTPSRICCTSRTRNPILSPLPDRIAARIHRRFSCNRNRLSVSLRRGAESLSLAPWDRRGTQTDSGTVFRWASMAPSPSASPGARWSSTGGCLPAVTPPAWPSVSPRCMVHGRWHRNAIAFPLLRLQRLASGTTASGIVCCAAWRRQLPSTDHPDGSI